MSRKGRGMARLSAGRPLNFRALRRNAKSVITESVAAPSWAEVSTLRKLWKPRAQRLLTGIAARPVCSSLTRKSALTAEAAQAPALPEVLPPPDVSMRPSRR